MAANSSFAKIVYLLALIATIIGFSAFSQPTTPIKPSKKQHHGNYNEKDAADPNYKNDGSTKLDQLDHNLKQLDVQMDQLKNEVQNIDFSKVQKQIDAAMKRLDAQKISLQVNESLKKIDWTELKRQLNESVAKLDKAKMEEVKSEMEKARAELATQKNNMRFEIPKIEAEKIKAETKVAFENAKKSMEKVKAELNNGKEFLKALQQDGLIDSSKASNIEVKNGELYIDGKKQSEEINDKYKKYYRKGNLQFNFQTNDTF
ncbi:MAG: hypothetical protein M3040_15635 [Bacteroidota bacterium]|nr:hypothetical protein [Bacteroidota bacterium]